MNDPIGIGIIGAGKMSNRHHLPVLAHLSKENKCNLVAICDLDINAAKKARDDFGFKSFTIEAEDLFKNNEISAIYIFGTVDTHYNYAKSALLAGKHVFIEKPPTPNYEKARELVAIADSRRKMIVAGFNRRFRKDILTFKEESLRLGQVLSSEAIFHKPALHVEAPAGARNWLHYNAIHALDTLLFTMGDEPSEIYSAENSIDNLNPQNFSALIKWPNGSHAVLSSNNSGGGKTESYTFHLPGISYECLGGNLVRVSQGGESITNFLEEGIEAGGFYAEHLSFIDSIEKGVESSHSLRGTKNSLKLVELIESGYSGLINWEKDSKLESLDIKIETKKLSEAKSDRKSILVLNPSGVKMSLPRIYEKYDLIYEEMVDNLKQDDLSRIVAVITGKGGVGIKDEILNKLSNLRVYGVVGASVKKYNPEPVVSRGVPIINASEAYADAVAEFALMQAIAGIRNGIKSHDVMRAGGWGISMPGRLNNFLAIIRKNKIVFSMRPLLLPIWKVFKKNVNSASTSPGKGTAANSFDGIRIGLIGYGSISKAFIAHLKHFNCEILINSDFLNDDEAKILGVRKASLAEVLACNVVSLHRGLSDRTINSIGAIELNQIRSGSVFINTSRAEIVNEEALVTRLKRGDIYACLDVFNEEPLPKKHPLRKMPNVFLTSHIAGSTQDMYKSAVNVVIDKVFDFLDGKDVSGLITDKKVLSNMS